MAIDIIASVIPDITYVDDTYLKLYVYLTPRVSCSGREPLENFRHIYNWTEYFDFFESEPGTVQFGCFKPDLSKRLDKLNIFADHVEMSGYRGDLLYTRDWQKTPLQSAQLERGIWAKTVWRSLVNKSTPVDGWEPDRSAYEFLTKADLTLLDTEMNKTIVDYKQKLLSKPLGELNIPGFYDSPEEEAEQRAGLLAILNHLLLLSPDRKLASPYINNPSKAINFPGFLQTLHDQLESFNNARTREFSDLSLKLSLAQVEERNTTETNEFHKKMAAFGNFPFLLKQTGWIWSYYVKKAPFLDIAITNPDCLITVNFRKVRPTDPINPADKKKLAIADFMDNVRFSYPCTAIKIRTIAGSYTIGYRFKPNTDNFHYLKIDDGVINTVDSKKLSLTTAEFLERNQVFDRISDILQQKYDFSYRADQPADSPENQASLRTKTAGQNPQAQQEISVINHERIHNGNRNSGRKATTDYNSVGVSLSFQNLQLSFRSAVSSSPEMNFLGTSPQVSSNVETQAILYGHNLHKGYRVDVFSAPAPLPTGEIPLPNLAGGRSLCRRKTFYTIDFKKQPFPSGEEGTYLLYPGCIVDEDEGWIVESAQGSNSGSLYVDGELCRYNDWSLCADKLVRGAEDTADARELAVSANSNIQIFSLPQEGSLPRLRYGRGYDMILRYVDVCGSGRTINLDPGHPDDGTYPRIFSQPDLTGQVTRLRTYPRTQAVGAPLAFLGNSLHRNSLRTNPYLDNSIGEDLITVVIRSKLDDSGKKFTTSQESVRYIAPPKLEFHIIKKHGVLDALMQEVAHNSPNDAVKKASERLMSLTTWSAQPKHLNQQEDTWEQVVSGSREIDYLFDPLVRGYQLFINGMREEDWSFPHADRSLNCTNPGKLYFDKIRYWKLTLAAPSNSNEAFDYDIPSSALTDFATRILLQEGMEKGLEFQASLVDHIATPDTATPFDVERIFYDGAITNSLKMRLIHAVQKPCLLYIRPDNSNFRPVYDTSSLDVAERKLAESTVNMVMSFDAFPCLTAETYILHAVYIDRISYRKKFLPDNKTVNTLGFQFDVVDKIIKTGFQPDRQGLEQLIQFSDLAHTFSDTKYRRVYYKLEAVSKFKKYFSDKIKDFSVYGTDPAAIRPKGNEIRLDPEEVKTIIKTWKPVLSANKPSALVVDRIVPLIRWEGTNLHTGLQRICDTIRIYLEGDWYTTGGHDEESVAIFFIEKKKLEAQKDNINSKNIPVELENVVSQMGVDPAADFTLPPAHLPTIDRRFFYQSNGTILPLVTFIQFDEQIMLKVKNLDFGNNGGDYRNYEVTAAIFKVQYMPPEDDETLGRFYVDVRIDREDQLRELYFPFIRFAIARYQPNTIDTLDATGEGIDSRFSKVVVTDFVQLLPYRKISLNAEGQLLYTAPATRRNFTSTPNHESNILVYRKGAGSLVDTARLETVDNANESPTILSPTAADTVVSKAEDLSKSFILEEYEQYLIRDDIKISGDTKPRADLRKRLILTYAHNPSTPIE